MLLQLSIQNIAVIQSAQINFTDGLNVFTGETGAGKSILIGAIGAVLGSRTSKELIRTGEKKALVSALFGSISPTVQKALADAGFFAEDDELLIEREITAESNVCRINGKLATVSILREIGERLIHTHGQQDSQLLAQQETHLGFVDDFGQLDKIKLSYREKYDKLCAIEKKLSSIVTDENEKARKIDLLRYEIDEIDSAMLIEGEQEQLLAKRKRMRNAEHIIELLYECRRSLLGDDDGQEGAVSLLSVASNALSQAGSYYEDLAALAEKAEGFGYELEDIASTLRDKLEELEFDPRELDSIEERLDLINRLQKKYGGSIEEILAYCEKARRQLEEIEFSDELVKKLSAEKKKVLSEVKEAATSLTNARIEAAQRLSQAIASELKELDMPAVQIEVQMKEKPFSENGSDEAQFMLSVNPGESLKPLSKIASGGEMSRIMLGIKNVLSDKQDIATLIFDEIDTGISGRAALKVGAKLQSAAKSRQVICVTHLAQVAAFGEHHLLIEKEVRENRTFTNVKLLDEKGRAQEIARIMNGEPITELAVQNAAELLENCRRR